MITETTYCPIEGHEDQMLIPYLCVSKYCDQQSRYICQECLVENLHYHNGQKPQIFSQDKLLATLQSSIADFNAKNKDLLRQLDEQYIKTLSVIIEMKSIIKNFKGLLQECIESDVEDNQFYSLSKRIQESFFELHQGDLVQILNIFDQQLLKSKKIDNINQMFQQFTKQSESLNNCINSLTDLSDYRSVGHTEYIQRILYSEDTQALNQVPDMSFYDLKISPNNQYLASVRVKDKAWISKQTAWGNKVNSSSQYFFELIDLQTHQSHNLRFNSTCVEFLQFSSDSQLLFYQEFNEPFCCFDIKNNQIQEYAHFPVLSTIQYIYQSQFNRAFVLSTTGQLQLLDMEYQFILFQNQTQNSDYLVSDNLNNVVISSGDSLEFWNSETGFKLSEYSLPQKLAKIELKIGSGISNLIVSYCDLIYILQIDYTNGLQINQIQKIQYEQRILSFSLVMNQQYMVILGEKGSIKIYDENFQVLKHIWIGSIEDRKNKLFDMCECSKDLKTITLISLQKNKVLYLTRKN